MKQKKISTGGNAQKKTETPTISDLVMGAKRDNSERGGERV